MPKVRSLSPLLLLVVAAFLITGAAPMAAALSGSVSDCSGARIVNANVTYGPHNLIQETPMFGTASE